MTPLFDNALTAQIADFLTEIGIEILPVQLPEPTFLPGILIDGGRILVDEEKLIYPGDLLHEAGHLAVVPGALRPALSGEVSVPETDMNAVEAHAVAWSYAAIVRLGIDPSVVFHGGGYRQCSDRLILTYRSGVYPGANGLEQAGMTATGARAAALGVPPYPFMLRWLRD